MPSFNWANPPPDWLGQIIRSLEVATPAYIVRSVRLPLIVADPCTNSAEAGVVVPIPTLPFLSTVRIFDDVAMVKSEFVTFVEVPIMIAPEDELIAKTSVDELKVKKEFPANALALLNCT